MFHGAFPNWFSILKKQEKWWSTSITHTCSFQDASYLLCVAHCWPLQTSLYHYKPIVSSFSRHTRSRATGRRFHCTHTWMLRYIGSVTSDVAWLRKLQIAWSLSTRDLPSARTVLSFFKCSVGTAHSKEILPQLSPWLKLAVYQMQQGGIWVPNIAVALF